MVGEEACKQAARTTRPPQEGCMHTTAVNMGGRGTNPQPSAALACVWDNAPLARLPGNLGRGLSEHQDPQGHQEDLEGHQALPKHIDPLGVKEQGLHSHRLFSCGQDKKKRPPSKNISQRRSKKLSTALDPTTWSQDQKQTADIGWCRVRAYSCNCVAREEA